MTPGGGNCRPIPLRPRPPFPRPRGRSYPRRRRGRRGVRRCPNRHQRWLAEEPPLLSWPLPGLGLSRPGERAGCGRDVAGPWHIPIPRKSPQPRFSLSEAAALAVCAQDPKFGSTPPKEKVQICLCCICLGSGLLQYPEIVQVSLHRGTIVGSGAKLQLGEAGSALDAHRRDLLLYAIPASLRTSGVGPTPLPGR